VCGQERQIEIAPVQGREGREVCLLLLSQRIGRARDSQPQQRPLLFDSL